MYQKNTILYDVIPLLSLTISITIMVITVSGFIYNTRCNRNLPDTSDDDTISLISMKHKFKDQNYSF